MGEQTCDAAIPFPKPALIPDVISKKEAAKLTEDVRELLHVSGVGGMGSKDRGVRKSETGYVALLYMFSIHMQKHYFLPALIY
jgi:hypothetical protein